MYSHARRVCITEPENGYFLRRKETTEGPKVLIVEDHDDSRDMLRTLMEMWGCRVVEARNGVEAVESAQRELPALILMDGSLPLLDGIAATRLIREDLQLRDVLIVALNGWGTSSFNTEALSAGCNDCFEKPIDFERLRRYLIPLFDPASQSTAKIEQERPRLALRPDLQPLNPLTLSCTD